MDSFTGFQDYNEAIFFTQTVLCLEKAIITQHLNETSA